MGFKLCCRGFCRGFNRGLQLDPYGNHHIFFANDYNPQLYVTALSPTLGSSLSFQKIFGVNTFIISKTTRYQQNLLVLQLGNII